MISHAVLKKLISCFVTSSVLNCCCLPCVDSVRPVGLCSRLMTVTVAMWMTSGSTNARRDDCRVWRVQLPVDIHDETLRLMMATNPRAVDQLLNSHSELTARSVSQFTLPSLSVPYRTVPHRTFGVEPPVGDTPRASSLYQKAKRISQNFHKLISFYLSICRRKGYRSV